MKRIATAWLILCLLAGPQPVSAAPAVGAAGYWVQETETGRILAEHHSEQALPAASLTKLMTCLLTLEAIERGELDWREQLTLPKDYVNPGGSSMELKAGESLTVRQLLEGLMIVSANDAAGLLAVRVAGSEDAFVKAMNLRARQLGMDQAVFLNPTGLPTAAGQNAMSPGEVGRLSGYLIERFGDALLDITAKSRLTDPVRNKNFRGTNTLILRKPEVDGLKTGHTDAAGYCLSATMPFHGRHDSRLIAVVMGTANEDRRDGAARSLLEWAEATFDYAAVIRSDGTVDAGLWQGLATRPVTAHPERTVERLLSKTDTVSLGYDIQLPMEAPLLKGDVIGTVTAELPDGEAVTVNLISDTEITGLTLRENLTLLYRAFSHWWGSLFRG